MMTRCRQTLSDYEAEPDPADAKTVKEIREAYSKSLVVHLNDLFEMQRQLT
jgi:hypothetical protein